MSAARPKVLEVVTLSDWGGAQGYVHALVRHLGARFDVTVACAPGGPLVQRLRDDGAQVITIPTLVRTPNPLADARTLWWLVRFMRRERFAIVHCHSTKAGLLGRVAARLAGVRGVVFTAHGWPFASGWSPLVRRAVTLAERVAAPLTSVIICVAGSVRDEALHLGIGRSDQLRVVHNGVAPEPWITASARYPRRASPAATAVMVGRLQAPKDPLTLIRAWQAVPAPHRLLVVGGGPLHGAASGLIARLGLADRVALLGPRTDVPALLAAADLFVLSSLREGLPLAVIEAMMSGLPVVATDVGGVGEAVWDGETGLLVPPRDADALAAALRTLIADPARRAAYGDAGRRRALLQFTEARMVDEIGRIYAGLLHGARTATRVA